MRVLFWFYYRQFLWSFRLPGEAQKIDRMMECFAERYCELNTGVFTSTGKLTMRSPPYHGIPHNVCMEQLLVNLNISNFEYHEFWITWTFLKSICVQNKLLFMEPKYPHLSGTGIYEFSDKSNDFLVPWIEIRRTGGLTNSVTQQV